MIDLTRRTLLGLLAATPLVPSAALAQNRPNQGAPSPLQLVGPIAQYKIYVTQNVRQFVTDTRAFVAAVKAGKIAEAQRLYAPTRTSYEKIEPVAELFSDLDAAIDSRADDHEKAEKDPRFGGFHRIEYALWVEKSTRNVGRTADKLMADVLALQTRLTKLTFPPEKVVGGAAVLMEEVAATKISGEENRYSRTDLYDFQANFEGAYKIVTLLRPLVERRDRAFAAKTEANFRTVFDTLAKYRAPGGGFVSYVKLTERDRKLLAGKVHVLAEDLSRLRGMLGLN
ncbi:iron uptake system protein EfeO [Sphingobium sp. WCS2017Hpa-17]|uniref:iron uptake system protein EfeO n=1 Tax=Sphingobium sp. WCS2017Hpa-17 TaxID=3073638 RepID=UPI00288BE769|nr:iron uptake system protein EfeO [Sphingobium sp. WCS2017Hpa-17]